MEEKRPRGRPSKAAGEKKVANLTFRVRPQMRDALAAAAEASGRSTSEEIEYRLTRSFEGGGDRATELLFGSRYNVRLMTMFAGALNSVSDFERHVAEDPRAEWYHSAFGQAAAAAAFDALTRQWVAPEDGKVTAADQATAADLAKVVLDRLYLEDEKRRHQKRLERGERGEPDYAKLLGLFAEDK